VRRHAAVAILLTTLAASTSAQVPRPSPIAPPVGQKFPQIEPALGFVEFGVVQPVDLKDVTDGLMERKAVRVQGQLGPLQALGQAQYFELRDLGSVVIIPLPEMIHDMPTLLGRRVEVVGFVRQLVREQGLEECDFTPRPASYCRDPTLPPTPDLKDEKSGWPTWSITIWSISDASPLNFRKGEALRLSDSLGTLQGGERRDVRVAGRFCGVGLCGPPPTPPPHPTAWLLQDGQEAVWVIGKEPRGKGWRLDPTYAADSRRWLEVAGRLERCGSAVCLRAKSVALSAPPGVAEPE
jgi:hypothetical protein